jgi:DNA-binding response OmpR family regulator
MQKPDGKKIRILVVEDEPVISQICSRVLTGEGFDVDIASNGNIAESMLEEKQYVLILIDIRTPVMNGKELYHSIMERHPEVVSGVIFTTGDMPTGDIKNFLEQSNRPFLPKPFTPDELKAVVKEALSRMGK